MQRGEHETLKSLLLQRIKKDPRDRNRLLQLGQLLESGSNAAGTLLDQELQDDRRIYSALTALQSEILP